jgi:hypothetical protein
VLLVRNFHYIYIKIKDSEFRQLKTKRQIQKKEREEKRKDLLAF